MSLRTLSILGVCLFLAAPAAFAANLQVLPDGSGDEPTIQAAIDAAAWGDTVTLGDGVYAGAGNHRLHVNGKAILIRSASDDPALCAIDCAGDGRSFFLAEDEGPGTRIEGITMKNGDARYPDYGGGAVYIYQTSPVFRNCVFENNFVTAASREPGYGMGGAIYVENGEPLFEDCVFIDNETEYDGGAVRCLTFGNAVFTGCVFDNNLAASGGGAISIDENSSPVFTGCVFDGNSAQYAGAVEVDRLSSPQFTDCEFHGNSAVGAGGALSIYYTSKPVLQGCVFTGNVAAGGGAIYTGYFSEPELHACVFHGNEATSAGAAIYSYYYSVATVDHSILAESAGGGAVHCQTGGALEFSCSDIWGNTGGDWTGCIASQLGVDGNFSADPLFCDAAGGNFRVSASSPCAAANAPAGCGTIGVGEGCIDVGVDRAEENAPRGLRLIGAAPNPFNPVTTIRYAVPAGGETVRLTIHDVTGRLVRTLVSGARSAGEHETVWDGRDDRGGAVASGVYFSRLTRGDESRTGRMVLIR